ncbi:related to GCP3 (gamma-tubulin complex) [Cephalotrichum gorgonifer]|uniref:Spindle pole body component n=1 Tax=Cephalotrichum gorgonifer TaxID=2041049 RepID=A0AAE8STL6_9PEZI|nr:related to GCP3 (gamma-tubulin complex) [Cephalotrichum gorgonifer]
MAFQAQLSAQAGELVECVARTSPKSRQFNKHREQVLRRLLHHSFLRTNQFEVETRLNGLEEIFRIQHREGLADALRSRLDRLNHSPEQWHPEILYLLLELSDQPLRNTRLESLKELHGPKSEPAPRLTWEDIAREDGWAQDPDLWRSVDYSDTSDDDALEDRSTESDDSDEQSASGEALWRVRKAEDVIINLQDGSKLQEIRDAHQWRLGPQPSEGDVRSHKVAITELHILREVLFMLRGYKTSLFPIDSTPDFTYQLPSVSWVTYKALINSFAEMGRKVGILRALSKQSQRAPHLQVFQDCVSRSLRSFDEAVTNIESRIILVKQDVVLSLVAASDELKAPLEPLSRLSDIVQQLEDSGHGAFRYLELLFLEIGNSQISGRRSTYEFLGRIFFDCFQYYLRPIRLWMQDGQLIPGDKLFFVSECATHVPMNEAWTSQFRLRRTADGNLYAPSFLHPSVNKIFTAGKSIVMLKHLGKYERDELNTAEASEPALDFDALLSPDLELAPFAELFDAAFERWIQSKHQATSAMLKSVLFESCGLWANLATMQLLYFMSDGALADSFCSSIFKKLDTLPQGWRDRYALTSLAQEVYSTSLDSPRLSVTIGQQGQRLPASTARDFVRKYLPELGLVFNVRWPVQMILTGESLLRYKTVFTLLLQLRRAHYMLNKQRFQPDPTVSVDNWSDRGGYYSIRSRLLWFCTTFWTYLSTLVLAPNGEKLRLDLEAAPDVDAMIEVHLAFTRRVMDEACLGAKLEPIKECILDILDLTIQLDKAYSLNALREAEEMHETSRLSLISSPARTPLKGTPRRGGAPRTRRAVGTSDDEDSENPDSDLRHGDPGSTGKSFGDEARGIQGVFESRLKFVSDGLRAVARATGSSAAAKWDILAEMLDAGVDLQRYHPLA